LVHRDKKRKQVQLSAGSPAGQPGSVFSDRIEGRLTPWRVAGAFALLTLAYTFPLILSPGKAILGRYQHYYGDIFWAIWQFWSAKVQLLELHASPFRFDLIAGPFNQSSVFTLHKFPTLMIPFTAAFGPVGAVNLYVLLNFTLSGLCTWLLVRELTGRNLAGVVAGLAFAFCPYAWARSIVHLDLAPIWTFPFLFYTAFRLHRDRSAKSWTLFVLALLALVIYSSPYYYLVFPLGFAAWLAVRFLDRFVFDFSQGRRVTGAFGRVTARQWVLAAAVTTALAGGAAAAYVLYLGPTAALVARPLLWQERFALGWANYLLPGVDHPLFKPITSALVPVRRNVTESAVYIGWVPLVLALVGLKAARRDWRAWVLVAFGLGAFSITLGPYLSLGYLKIPMPSLVIHKFAPFIRAIGRYSIFLQMTVAVLAGYGVAELAKRLALRKSFSMLMGALVLLLAVEFAHPAGLTRVATRPEEAPPVYARLASLSDCRMIFECPPVAVTGMTNTDYFFFQTIHRKELFNRFFDVTNIPPKYFPFWLEMDYPGAITDPVNVELLRYFGVDCVVRHERNQTGSPHLPLPDFSAAEGLELVQDFGREAIYRVTADSATVLLAFDTRPFYNYSEVELELRNEGFEPPQVLSAGRAGAIGWRVMLGRGKIRARNLLARPHTVEIRALAAAFGRTRRVRALAAGKPVAQFELASTQATEIRIPGIQLPPEGLVEITLESLDGTSTVNSLDRQVEASAAFSRFRVVSAD